MTTYIVVIGLLILLGSILAALLCLALARESERIRPDEPKQLSFWEGFGPEGSDER